MKKLYPLSLLLFNTTLILSLTACVSTNETKESGNGLAETQQVAYKEFIQQGDTLPIKMIVDVEGKQVNLADNNKRKLVILFATWCSDSNRALKALNQSPLLQDDNIEIIAIAREESLEQVIAWRDKHKINVPLAVDSDRSIYNKFAGGGIPRLITVTKDNNIIKMNLAEGNEQLSLIQW